MCPPFSPLPPSPPPGCLAQVFEECRNLCLGLASRGIDWRQQGLRGSLIICVGLASKLFSNLLARCDNIAVAMTARGFQGPQRHVLHAATPPLPSGIARLLPSLADWGLLLCLGLLTAASWVVL